MRRITSALFLDFDNIFSGLLEADRDAAMALVERPGAFIDRLGSLDADSEVQRDLLVRRAYLNPKGTVPDPESRPNPRLHLSRYRPHLMRAGFEVIDCPALTAGQKNAADIRMVIDVLDAVAGPVRYDEIIIASSDADFTPLLLKLRAGDRRTMILTAGTLAPPYRAVADRFIDETQLIGLLLGSDEAGTEEPSEPLSPQAEASAEEQAVAAVMETVAASPAAVSLSAVGNAVHDRVGTDTVRATKWFGRATLTRFVQVRQPHLVVNTLSVWDPARHDGPPPPAATSDALAAAEPAVAPSVALPPIIAEVCAITDLPKLSSATWVAVFETLEQAAREGPIKLTDRIKWSRDRLAETETSVSRAALSFIARGTALGGIVPHREPKPSAAELCQAFVRAMTERAGALGLDLDDRDAKDLLDWLSGNG